MAKFSDLRLSELVFKHGSNVWKCGYKSPPCYVIHGSNVRNNKLIFWINKIKETSG